MVVAGNSTMRDLFFRLDVYSIGQSPYQSITELEMAEGRRDHDQPGRARRAAAAADPSPGAGLRPADHQRPRRRRRRRLHAGGGPGHEERLVAVMDIGTNTELILGNKHKILAASCPAGPAFEGGKISCGMPGLPGAIEKVRIDADGSVAAAVIGDGPAEGICGSGLVDLLSELLRTGRMNSLGRFEDGGEPVRAGAAGERPICFTRPTSTSWPRPRAPTSPACTSSSTDTACASTTSTSSTWPAVLAGI